MKKIIAISGLATSGKDSTADILSELLGGKNTKVPMARELKHLAEDYLNWNGQKGEEGREILQRLGTDIIRNKLNKPLFHVQRAVDTIEIISDYFDYIFCTDIRFVNEIMYLKACFPNDVIHINVERIGTNEDDNLNKEQHNHASETGMIGYDNYDYVIKSESGLDNLKKAIEETMIDFIDGELLQDILHLGDKVKIIDIKDKTKAGHLTDFIGREGYLFSKIVYKGVTRYKVFFNDNEIYYFRANELEVI